MKPLTILVMLCVAFLITIAVAGCAHTQPVNVGKVNLIDGSVNAKVWVCAKNDKNPNQLDCTDSGPIFAYVCSLPQLKKNAPVNPPGR